MRSICAKGITVVVDCPCLNVTADESLSVHGKYFQQLVRTGWLTEPKVDCTSLLLLPFMMPNPNLKPR